jgi:hypothetical protein
MRLPARERDENSLSEPCGTPCPSAPVGENPNSEAALGRSEAGLTSPTLLLKIFSVV